MKFRGLVRLCLGVSMLSLSSVAMAGMTCLGALDDMQKGVAGAGQWYWDNCNAQIEASGRNVRADENIPFSTFKTTYNGTLTAAVIDGVVKAFNAVLFAPNNNACYSFDPPPGGGTAGFASPPSSTKSFCASPRTDSNFEKITFGVLGTTSGTGTDGSVTMPMTGHGFSFGSTPEASPDSSHTLNYVEATMTALTAADVNATAANVNAFITQIFVCGTAAKALPKPVGCMIGDATVGGEAFVFKISITTGTWGLTSMPSITYKMP